MGAVLRARVSVGRADLPTLLAVGLLDTAGNALFPVASTESLLSVCGALAGVTLITAG